MQRNKNIAGDAKLLNATKIFSALMYVKAKKSCKKWEKKNQSLNQLNFTTMEYWECREGFSTRDPLPLVGHLWIGVLVEEIPLFVNNLWLVWNSHLEQGFTILKYGKGTIFCDPIVFGFQVQSKSFNSSGIKATGSSQVYDIKAPSLHILLTVDPRPFDNF